MNITCRRCYQTKRGTPEQCNKWDVEHLCRAADVININEIRPAKRYKCLCWCGQNYVMIPKTAIGKSTLACSNDYCAPNMILIKSVVVTCTGCPTQLEGLLTNNQFFYARSRHGKAMVGVGRTQEDAVRNALQHTERYKILETPQHEMTITELTNFTLRMVNTK